MTTDTNTSPETPVEQMHQTQSSGTSPQTSFAQLRKKLEEKEAENAALTRRAQELEEFNRKRKATEEEEEDDDEPYVAPKKLKKEFANFESKFERIIDQKAEQKARSLMEEEKRNSYLKENNDFYDVMNESRIHKFAESNPRIAEAILKMPSGFERDRLVYESVKAIEGATQKATTSSIQEKIDKNKNSYYYQPSHMATPSGISQGDFSPDGQRKAFDYIQGLKKRLTG